MFQSINELDKFSYKDCVIKSVTVREDTIILQVEALIVEPDNSQNTNYTRSYAGDTTITYTQGRIGKVVKEGYRYYDANDILQEEVPDTVLSEAETVELMGQLANTYLYDIQMLDRNEVSDSDDLSGKATYDTHDLSENKIVDKAAPYDNAEGNKGVLREKDAGKICVLGIEFPPEDPNDLSLATDSYQIMVFYENVTVEWERYMNRVEG